MFEMDDKIIEILTQIQNNMHKMQTNMNEMNTRLDRIEQKQLEHDKRLDRIEQKQLDHDKRLNRIDQKQLEHDKRFDELNDTIKHVDEQASTIAIKVMENTAVIGKIADDIDFISHKEWQMEKDVFSLKKKFESTFEIVK